MNSYTSPVSTEYHGDDAIHQRIRKLIEESRDPEFSQYLNQLGSALWNGQISDETAGIELEKNYAIYKQKIYPGQFKEIEKPVEAPRKNMEFTVGAGVLGVTGAAFLLIAFVIFAMNFMSGFVKGICLYVISMAVVLIAELLVRRKQEKFALGMTGVGISGLFLSTIINYVYFSIFNSIIAFIIIILITIGTFVLSLKRDSGVLRLIALLGSVVCLFPMVSYKGTTEFLITGAMIILIQEAAAFVPAKRNQNTIWILQMIVLAISLLMFVIRAISKGISYDWITAFSVLMIALLQLLFCRAKVYAGSVVTYCVVYFLSIFCLGIFRMEHWKIYTFVILPVGIISLLFSILIKHKICRWLPYWFFLYIVVQCFLTIGANGIYLWQGFATVLALFCVAKILSKVDALKWSELGITLFALLYQIGVSSEYCGSESVKIWLTLILTIMFLGSAFLMPRWHFVYELTITASVVVCVFKLCSGIIRLPLIAGILVLGMFLFALNRNKKRSSMCAYNIFALSMLSICYIWLAFADNILIYIFLLLLGITVFVFMFEEKYALSDKNKFLWMGIFLTYMFLILNAGNSIINSVLMAATAILCVGAGFGAKQKAARIYGLVLAIITALKVAIFDFAGSEPVQRMLAFLLVGILILVISYIYILLEKKMSRDETEKG